jgi:hypothetical protein
MYLRHCHNSTTTLDTTRSLPQTSFSLKDRLTVVKAKEMEEEDNMTLPNNFRDAWLGCDHPVVPHLTSCVPSLSMYACVLNFKSD